MKKRSTVVFFCGVITALACGLLLGMGKMNARPDESKRGKTPESTKRAREFIAAFDRGDAKAVAAFWTEEGSYVDQDGVEVKGRDALRKMYQSLFSELKGAKLTITTTSSRTLAPGVVAEEGISQLKIPGGPPSLSRFYAVLVKKDDAWYLDSLRESGVKPPSHAEKFADLEWLIGDWAGENEKGVSGTDSFEWAENQNFVVSSFATTVEGVPVSGGTRWIAWDAADNKIRSWSFYSGGGFSEGVWTKNGDSWTIQTTGTTAAGKKISATHVLRKMGAGNATWQTTELTVDGKNTPAPASMKFKRVKEEQGR